VLIHTIAYDSDINRNKVLIYIKTWMELRSIVLSEKKKSQDDILTFSKRGYNYKGVEEGNHCGDGMVLYLEQSSLVRKQNRTT
jgi:hypothetical protein